MFYRRFIHHRWSRFKASASRVEVLGFDPCPSHTSDLKMSCVLGCYKTCWSVGSRHTETVSLFCSFLVWQHVTYSKQLMMMMMLMLLLLMMTTTTTMMTMATTTTTTMMLMMMTLKMCSYRFLTVCSMTCNFYLSVAARKIV